MTPQDHKVKITDSIMAIVAMILMAYCAYLLHDYQVKKLQNPPIEYKIIQVPQVDLYDTIYTQNSTPKTQH
jgi:hypothetical protein